MPSAALTPTAYLEKSSRITDSENRLQLSIVLTFLLLLLYSHRYWYVNIPLSILAIAGIFLPALRTSRVLWGTVAAIVALGSLPNWYSIDNHKYLLGYWCIAIFCCLLSTNAGRSLAVTARWLIGLVFFLAVVQKTVSDDYLNGAFIYYELLLDERFSGLARYIGGIPEHMRELNLAAHRALVNYDSRLEVAQLLGTKNIGRLAIVITWWNYLIQVVIGLAFLLPGRFWLYGRRDVFLLVFLFTTYLFAPVIGFGWVLAIMGIVQTEDEKTTTRTSYLAAFLFLHGYRLPWDEILQLIQARG